MKRSITLTAVVFCLAVVTTACLGIFTDNNVEQNTYLDLRENDNNNQSDRDDRDNDSYSASGDQNTSNDEAPNTEALEIAPEIGALAPNFTLSTLSGEVVRLGDFRGQVVMINFWAVWCPPCIEELPAIQAVFEDYGDEVVLLLVNSGDAYADVEAFIHSNDYTFNCLLDSAEKVSNQYRVRSIPMTFFIDEFGVIHSIRVGGMDEDKILDYLVEAGFEQ